LLTQLRNDQTPVAGIVRAAHQVLVTNTYDLPHLSNWHRDHMLIIGDAAHAASPATGQGASMALEDAVILAKSLRDRPDPASAFVTYEQLRRDRVQADINRSARMSAQSRLDWSRLPPENQQAPDPNKAINTQLQWHTPLAQP
jgi:2-polyprenyl-6-methoxyphenol hydroxylase-like FAD-dependent oxidoreductase